MCDQELDEVLSEVVKRFSGGESVKIFGKVIHEVRQRRGYTYLGYSEKTGLPRIWLAMLEWGLVTEDELTDEEFVKLWTGLSEPKIPRGDFLSFCNEVLNGHVPSEILAIVISLLQY